MTPAQLSPVVTRTLSPRGTTVPGPWPEPLEEAGCFSRPSSHKCGSLDAYGMTTPCSGPSSFWCGDPCREEQIGHVHPRQVLVSMGVMRNRAGAGEGRSRGRRGGGTGNIGDPGRGPEGNSGEEHPRQEGWQVCVL